MRKKFDVIVIGTGIAGLSASIFLKEAGFDVIALTKAEDIHETNTNRSQGGIIGWKKDDSSDALMKDILSAGSNYNNIEAVKIFAEQGPQLVNDFFINKLNVDFSKASQGELDYTEEAAHSTNRILHCSDYTGEKLENSLIQYAKRIGVQILTSHTSIDLITNNHHSRDYQELYKPREVMGVYVLDNKKGTVRTFLAHKVIVATGGIGNLYQHTTNPVSATGDGMSMAYRSGADIINAELIQFHPTALYHKDIKRFLISESLRGEGARLIDHQGRQFMKNYSSQKDLAPRDIVARAIYTEMKKAGVDYMLLDLKNYYNGSEEIPKRFSKIYNTCLKGGIDITKEPIPIVPAAHYFCGGIKVDACGRTSLKNLYAIGEISCTGLHGANRLASSSLAEGLLWAKRASNDIISKGEEIDEERFQSIPNWSTPKKQIEFDPLLLEQDLKAIQLTMWNYAGIIRTKRGLERARSDLNYYAHRIFKFYQDAKLSCNIIELRNVVVNALIIVNAATHNKKSIGCHYIENSPLILKNL